MDRWTDHRASAEVLWEFGTRLKVARMRAGLSIEETAETAGVTTSEAKQIEAGKLDPDLDQIVGLAKAVGASLASLLNNLDSANPPMEAGARAHSDT